MIIAPARIWAAEMGAFLASPVFRGIGLVLAVSAAFTWLRVDAYNDGARQASREAAARAAQAAEAERQRIEVAVDEVRRQAAAQAAADAKEIAKLKEKANAIDFAGQVCPYPDGVAERLRAIN